MKQEVAVGDLEPGITDSWEDCLDYLRGKISSPYFASMITPLRPLSLEEGTFTIAVPNTFTKDMVESRFIDRLTEAASKALGKECRIVLTVASPPGIVESMASRLEPTGKQPEAHAGRPTGSSLSEGTPPGQKKYTFENFVVGDSNKFAYNAALMVAEVPGHNYNPLFIYGGTGLGKTHLLLAIKDYSEKLNPSIKVRLVQTSQFIDEFVTTLTMKRDMATFDQKYINNKIVLFDDIQALSGTDATQNKFFDIFNLMYHSNSHIVLSSDRLPSDMARLSDRIQSRFEGGLIIDIKPPDLETRLAILRMRARTEKVEVPDDAMIYIASKVKENIRTMEGLLNRVVAHHQLYGMKIDLPMVQEVLKDQVSEPDQSRAPTIDLIQNLVSNFYSIPGEDLTGKNRSRSLVHGRQVAMYLCREFTSETLISIGGKFGGRDHSTVLHSYRKVELLIKQRKDILREVHELTNMINKSL